MYTRLRMALPDQELLKLYKQRYLSREIEERCADHRRVATRFPGELRTTLEKPVSLLV